MRIGIFPSLNAGHGGIHQYGLTVIDAAEQIGRDEFLVLSDEEGHPAIRALRARGWTIGRVLPPRERSPLSLAIDSIVGEGPHRNAWRRLRNRVSLKRNGPSTRPRSVDTIDRPAELATWWRERHQIGLMLYPFPTPLSFEVGIPYVITVHDVQHRLQPEFQEVAGGGEWERREYLYRNCGRNALAVIVHSKTERDDFLSFYEPYGVDPDRVKVLPPLPASYATVSSADDLRLIARKYELPERYVIYPGQLWPHKNHARVIQALERVKLTHGIAIPAVFCGSHFDQIRDRQRRLLMRMAEECGVSMQISWLGYVPEEDMAGLYQGATALVMPTLFGPTNMPPLEAWVHGCAVITSETRGARELYGDAALLVDPRSTEAIADATYRVWTDEGLRRRLTACGSARVKRYGVAEFSQGLSEILSEAGCRIPQMAVSV
jgi:glycosyltransferase involved in cell wall biosynthesis